MTAPDYIGEQSRCKAISPDGWACTNHHHGMHFAYGSAKELFDVWPIEPAAPTEAQVMQIAGDSVRTIESALKTASAHWIRERGTHARASGRYAELHRLIGFAEQLLQHAAIRYKNLRDPKLTRTETDPETL